MTKNKKIVKRNKPVIGFIGQGWIGKNYADNFESRGYKTIRYALEKEYIKNGKAIGRCDIVFIAVPTPSTPQGFKADILKEAIKKVGKGKIAVIKSTVYPGLTEIIQKENPDLFVLHSPEFLTESTAAYDAAHPVRNIIGLPIDNQEYRQKAKAVMAVLPRAPYELICSAREAELIKYGGNNWFYFKVVFVNMLYDLASKLGARWEIIKEAMAADPRIGSSHLNPVHSSGQTGGEVSPKLKFSDLHLEVFHNKGRGAGGHCFIKDFAAFSQVYQEKMSEDVAGLELLQAIKNKNLELLVSTNKDLDLLAGVYGQEIIDKIKNKKGKVNNELVGASIAREKKQKKQDKIKGKKCLVTGGAGFIGSNLVDELVRLGCDVVIIDNLSTGKKENLNPQAQFHQLDIRDLDKIKPLFSGVDYVFHLAAFPRVQPSIEDPAQANDINLNGTLNVLVASRDARVKKVIYSSSSSVYGDQKQMPLREDMPALPLSPYGLQKYMGELYCRLFSEIYGLPTVSLRYFNVYGKRQALEGAYCLVMGIFVNQRLNNQPMTITSDGEQRRDFTSVVDVVRANILAAESGRVGDGEVINIGRGKNYSVNELARMIGGPTVNIPPRIEPKETLADNSLAKELLGWEPTVELPQWLKGYKKEMGLE